MSETLAWDTSDEEEERLEPCILSRSPNDQGESIHLLGARMAPLATSRCPPAVPTTVTPNINYCELGETLMELASFCELHGDSQSVVTAHKFQAFFRQSSEAPGGDLTQWPAEFTADERRLWEKLQVTTSNIFIQIRAQHREVRVGTRTGPVDPFRIVWLSPPQNAIEPDRYLCRMRGGAFDVFRELCPALESRELSKYVRMHRYYQHRVEKPNVPLKSSLGSDGDLDPQDGEDEGVGPSNARGRKRPDDTTGSARTTKRSKGTTLFVYFLLLVRTI